MNWTVRYRPAAEDQLADLWTSSPDRGDIAAAADRIDELLRRDPYAQGESREGSKRILVVAPLAIYYTVSVPDRTVYVSDVWRWGRPP